MEETKPITGIKQRKKQRFVLGLATLLLVLAPCRCCSGDSVVVKESGNVTGLSETVWAGSGSAPPKVPPSQTVAITSGQVVSTDDSGEAQIDFSGCPAIYLFKNSGLQTSACRKTDAGNQLCAQSGAAAFRKCSSAAVIQTPSADLKLTGTWFSTIYLPERQLTLLTVMEGEISAGPVLDMQSGRTGPGIPVPAGHFLYTMPDPPQSIADLPVREPLPLAELPRMAEALGGDVPDWLAGIEELARLDGAQPPPVETIPPPVETTAPGGANELPIENQSNQEARLQLAGTQGTTGFYEFILPPGSEDQPAFQSHDIEPGIYELTIWRCGEQWEQLILETQAGLPAIVIPPCEGAVPATEAPGAANNLDWIMLGEAFDDVRVQKAVLNAIPWPEIIEKVFAGDASIQTNYQMEVVDIRDFAFDPEAARAAMFEAGYDVMPLTLLYNPTDPQLREAVEAIAQYLNESGVFKVALSEVTPSDGELKSRMMVAAGENVIWFRRR